MERVHPSVPRTMNFPIQDNPYLLVSFLLTATISNIVKPGGRQTFEDVKNNILSFSPFRSLRIISSLVIYLLHLRLLNIAEMNTGLRLLSHVEFPSDSSGLRCEFWPRFARRVFLIGGTLPLYAILLASTSNRWLHALMASFVAEPVLAEVLWFYRDCSHDGFIVQRGWPHRTMLVSTTDYRVHDHTNDTCKRHVTETEEEDRDIASPSTLNDNLCDRIHQLWSKDSDQNIHFTASSLNSKLDSKLERILSLYIRPAQWTCGHWRCLVYMISFVLRIISFAWYIEQALITWLLHVDIHPKMLQLSQKMLRNNVLGGTLTYAYQISCILTPIVSAHFFSRLLLILLYKQRRIKQACQDFANFAPITHKGMQLFSNVFMPNILGLVLARTISSHCILLTGEKLSYSLEMAVMSIIYIMGYRLLISVSYTSTKRGSQSASVSPLTPDTPSKSDCQETTNSAASASASPPTYLEDKAKVPQGGSYPRIATSSRFQIFRLAIMVPTLVVWIFNHW